MSTFTERYGNVKYAANLHKVYPGYTTGMCEIGVCVRELKQKLRQTKNQVIGNRSRMAILSEPDGMQQLRDYYDGKNDLTDTEFITWVETNTIRLERTAENLRKRIALKGVSRLYFDHCHEHGWVRGLLCPSCNLVMRDYDAGIVEENSRTYWQDEETYRRYRLNCPDCLFSASESVAA